MSAPIRALFVDRGLFFGGGVSKVILSLASHLDKRRVQMHFTALKGQEPLMQNALAFQGVQVHPSQGDAYIGPAWRLRRLVRAQGIEMIVPNCFRSYLVARLATLFLPVRIVYWIHSTIDIAPGSWRARVYSALTQRTPMLFASQVARQLKCPPGHAAGEYVVYNGVEAPEQNPEWQPYPRSKRPDLGLADGDFVVICTGSFEPLKNQRVLIEAFHLLATSHPRLHLLFVGGGLEHPALEARTRALPHGERVHFVGMRHDARQLLGLADLCVHPSYAEAFGLVAVEAMLAGTPLIVANAGALPELVRPGETGLLFDAFDPADLARQISEVMAHPEAAQQRAEAARTDARTRFSPAHFADQIADALVHEAARVPGLLPQPESISGD